MSSFIPSSVFSFVPVSSSLSFAIVRSSLHRRRVTPTRQRQRNAYLALHRHLSIDVWPNISHRDTKRRLQQAHASGTRECAFWRNATSGNLTDVPHATRAIHASGYYQTPTMATTFTCI